MQLLKAFGDRAPLGSWLTCLHPHGPSLPAHKRDGWADSYFEVVAGLQGEMVLAVTPAVRSLAVTLALRPIAPLSMLLSVCSTCLSGRLKQKAPATDCFQCGFGFDGPAEDSHLDQQKHRI